MKVFAINEFICCQFHLLASEKEFEKYSQLITEHGGEVILSPEDEILTFASESKIYLIENNVYKLEYITDCIKFGKLLDPDDYMWDKKIHYGCSQSLLLFGEKQCNGICFLELTSNRGTVTSPVTSPKKSSPTRIAQNPVPITSPRNFTQGNDNEIQAPKPSTSKKNDSDDEIIVPTKLRKVDSVGVLPPKKPRISLSLKGNHKNSDTEPKIAKRLENCNSNLDQKIGQGLELRSSRKTVDDAKVIHKERDSRNIPSATQKYLRNLKVNNKDPDPEQKNTKHLDDHKKLNSDQKIGQRLELRSSRKTVDDEKVIHKERDSKNIPNVTQKDLRNLKVNNKDPDFASKTTKHLDDHKKLNSDKKIGQGLELRSSRKTVGNEKVILKERDSKNIPNVTQKDLRNLKVNNKDPDFASKTTKHLDDHKKLNSDKKIGQGLELRSSRKTVGNEKVILKDLDLKIVPNVIQKDLQNLRKNNSILPQVDTSNDKISEMKVRLTIQIDKKKKREGTMKSIEKQVSNLEASMKKSVKTNKVHLEDENDVIVQKQNEEDDQNLKEVEIRNREEKEKHGEKIELEKNVEKKEREEKEPLEQKPQEKKIQRNEQERVINDRTETELQLQKNEVEKIIQLEKKERERRERERKDSIKEDSLQRKNPLSLDHFMINERKRMKLQREELEGKEKERMERLDQERKENELLKDFKQHKEKTVRQEKSESPSKVENALNVCKVLKVVCTKLNYSNTKDQESESNNENLIELQTQIISKGTPTKRVLTPEEVAENLPTIKRTKNSDSVEKQILSQVHTQNHLDDFQDRGDASSSQNSTLQGRKSLNLNDQFQSSSISTQNSSSSNVPSILTQIPVTNNIDDTYLSEEFMTEDEFINKAPLENEDLVHQDNWRKLGISPILNETPILTQIQMNVDEGLRNKNFAEEVESVFLEGHQEIQSHSPDEFLRGFNQGTSQKNGDNVQRKTNQDERENEQINSKTDTSNMNQTDEESPLLDKEDRDLLMDESETDFENTTENISPVINEMNDSDIQIVVKEEPTVDTLQSLTLKNVIDDCIKIIEHDISIKTSPPELKNISKDIQKISSEKSTSEENVKQDENDNSSICSDCETIHLSNDGGNPSPKPISNNLKEIKVNNEGDKTYKKWWKGFLSDEDEDEDDSMTKIEDIKNESIDFVNKKTNDQISSFSSSIKKSYWSDFDDL